MKEPKRKPADLVVFAEEILNKKLHFFAVLLYFTWVWIKKCVKFNLQSFLFFFPIKSHWCPAFELYSFVIDQLEFRLESTPANLGAYVDILSENMFLPKMDIRKVSKK